MDYDLNKDFLPQFKANSKKLLDFISQKKQNMNR